MNTVQSVSRPEVSAVSFAPLRRADAPSGSNDGRHVGRGSCAALPALQGCAHCWAWLQSGLGRRRICRSWGCRWARRVWWSVVVMVVVGLGWVGWDGWVVAEQTRIGRKGSSCPPPLPASGVMAKSGVQKKRGSKTVSFKTYISRVLKQARTAQWSAPASLRELQYFLHGFRGGAACPRGAPQNGADS